MSQSLELNYALLKGLPKAVVLCIDDDEGVLECEKVFLETFGHTVVTASSGREGLELARFHSFDVVIVDYCMPEMNGYEFAMAMRRLKPVTPIILFSGAVDIPEQVLDLVDAFVRKDSLASRLLPAIAVVCRLYPQQEPNKKGPSGHDLTSAKSGA